MSKAIHKELLERTGRFPTLNQLIATNGPMELERKADSDFFRHLARTAAGQQLSKAAASTIWGRIEIAVENAKTDLYSFCCPDNAEALRGCGLSKFKIKAIIDLKKSLEEDFVSPELFATNNADIIISKISQLWGFGQWSAEMTALFFFACPDIWSDGDAALKRGLVRVSSADDTNHEKILDSTKPYRSYLSLHLWKGIDTKRL